MSEKTQIQRFKCRLWAEKAAKRKKKRSEPLFSIVAFALSGHRRWFLLSGGRTGLLFCLWSPRCADACRKLLKGEKPHSLQRT